MEPPKQPRPVIALFTSFHPDIGGGSVHLRNAIEHLPEFDVRWFYLGTRASAFPWAECIGRSELGGPLAGDLAKSALLWGRGSFALRERLLEKIQACGADMAWVVAMGEGIAAGNAILEKLALPLHVTVHDDPARTLAGRSRRYRWFMPWVARSFAKLMTRCQSVDVISEAMRQVYLQELGVDSLVFYRHLRALPGVERGSSDSSILWLGHIGAVYGQAELEICLRAFGLVCQQRNKRCGVRFFGESRFGAEFMRQRLPPNAEVEVFDTTPEAEAVPQLARCDVAWAMYPFDSRSATFRQTSLPTKISSYLLAQRPVFAQSPAGSTLDTLVTTHAIGAVAHHLSIESAVAALDEALDAPRPSRGFDEAREALCGRHNIERLSSAFHGLLKAGSETK